MTFAFRRESGKTSGLKFGVQTAVKPASPNHKTPARKPAERGLLRILDGISEKFGTPLPPTSTPLMVLPVDPHRATVFWSNPATESAPKKSNTSSKKTVLRFKEVRAGAAPARFDVPVDSDMQHRTIQVWRPGATYTVELGDKQGRTFHSRAAAQALQLPHPFPASGAEAATMPPPPPPQQAAPDLSEQNLDAFIRNSLAEVSEIDHEPIYATELFGPSSATSSSNNVTSSTTSSIV
jgi:hypothetical protein